MNESKMTKAIRAAEQALENLKKTAALFRRFEVEPESGSVIRFTKRFPRGGKGYSYAALRTDKGWYLTGRYLGGQGGDHSLTWDQLVEFIGDGKAWLCSEWTEVPTINPEIPADDTTLIGKMAAFLNNASGRDTKEVARAMLDEYQRYQAARARSGADGARPAMRFYDDRATD